LLGNGTLGAWAPKVYYLARPALVFFLVLPHVHSSCGALIGLFFLISPNFCQYRSKYCEITQKSPISPFGRELPSRLLSQSSLNKKKQAYQGPTNRVPMGQNKKKKRRRAAPGGKILPPIRVGAGGGFSPKSRSWRMCASTVSAR
jgi:hypothetical protein